MKAKKKLDAPLTEPNNATNEALDNKESDNLSLQNFTHLNVPFTRTGIRSRKMNENSQKLSPDLNATDHSQLPKSKELDSVVKLRRRDISKRKLKPSWKLSEYLGIGDSATIDSTCNDDYAEKCSPLDDMTLEMEVVSVPTPIDESISQAQAPLDGRLSINEDTDIGTSNKGQESFAINDSMNNINQGNEHIWLNSERRDFQTTGNETVYQNYDRQRFEDEQVISNKDPCHFTEEKDAEEILQTKENVNDLSNRDMNSIHGSKQICVNNSSTPKANKPESDEYLAHLNVPSRDKWKRKSEPTLQIYDYTSSEDADKKAKKSPHSTEKNIDISQENHSKEVNATNTNIPQVYQSEEVEIAQLRYRDKGKRALKPTWKLSDNLSITKANKKVKRSCHSLEKIDTGVIIDRKDNIERTASQSGPQQNPTDVENQKAISSAKINTDKERKLELKRRRKQQKTEKLLHAKTLYSVTAGDSSNMYYLLKKKIKKPARNCTSLKKTDTVINDIISETIPVSVYLEANPDSYCIEDFTDLARDSRGKSVEEKNCQRFLCKICNSYRTLLIDDLRQHIELHINGKLNCRTCNFIANSLYNLRCHINESHHESRGAVICELCGTFKGSSDSYKAHASKVHGIAVYNCSHCENAFHRIQALKEHTLTVHKSCAFQCDKCRGIFMSQNGLENHLKKCVEKLYTCKYCNFARNSKTIVRMHVKTRHSKESTHKCSICTFSAVSKQQLTNHMNAHLGIHKYSCELCAFSCVKKYQLESHQRRHSGEKKFKCDKCCYAAAWNVQLKTHMKAHDSDTQCICKVCGIVLKDKRCLKLHKKKDHNNAFELPSGMSDE